METYRRQGYLLLPGLLGAAELAELSAEYDALFQRKRREAGRLEAVWAGDWRGETSSTRVSILIY